METLAHPKFGTCTIKSVIGNNVTIITPDNEEKVLMKCFADKFAGKILKETEAAKKPIRGKVEFTGNGYFILTYRGKVIKGRDVHNTGSYHYNQTAYVNSTDFKEEKTIELVNNSLPHTPDTVVIAA